MSVSKHVCVCVFILVAVRREIDQVKDTLAGKKMIALFHSRLLMGTLNASYNAVTNTGIAPDLAIFEIDIATVFKERRPDTLHTRY